MQIIDSFLEVIEIDSTNVDSFSNEESILDICHISLNEIKEKKIIWMKNFVKSKGFSLLVKVLKNLIKRFSKKSLHRTP